MKEKILEVKTEVFKEKSFDGEFDRFTVRSCFGDAIYSTSVQSTDFVTVNEMDVLKEHFIYMARILDMEGRNGSERKGD